jgi:hypothetical protein
MQDVAYLSALKDNIPRVLFKYWRYSFLFCSPMSGFDGNHVFTVSVHDPPAAASPDSPSQTEKLLLEFLLQYRVGGEFIYRSVL